MVVAFAHQSPQFASDLFETTSPAPELMELIIAGVRAITDNNRAAKREFDARFKRNSDVIDNLIANIGIVGDLELIVDAIKRLSHEFIRDLQTNSDQQGSFAVNLAQDTLNRAFERLPRAAQQNEMVQYFMEQAVLVVRESVQISRTQLNAKQNELLTDLRINYAQLRFLHQAALANPCRTEYYKSQFSDQLDTMLGLSQQTVQSYWELTAFLIQSASKRVLKLMEAAMKVRYNLAIL